MIIQCDNCKTAFESEEGVIAGDPGVQVRCLQCGAAARILPVSQTDALRNHEASRSAAPRASLSGIQPRWTPARMRLIVSALVLLILALGFNAMLSLSSLEKLYVESIVSKYSLVGKDLKRNVEKSLRFGKSIEKFINIKKILMDTRENLISGDAAEKILATRTSGKAGSVADISVSVALPDGKILYSTDNRLKGTQLPQNARRDYGKARERGDAVEHDYGKYGQRYWITLPIYAGFKKSWAGTVVISFHENQIKVLLDSVFRRNLITITVILAAGFFLLIIVLNFILLRSARDSRFPRHRISWAIFIVIALSQIVFTGFNTNAFKDYYLRINKEKIIMLGSMLKEDIEYFLSIGRPIDKLAGLDKMMGEILAAAPELENITLFDNEGRPLYIATKKGVTNFQKAIREQPRLAHEFLTQFDEEYNIRLMVRRGEDVQGYVAAEADEGYLSTNLSKDVIFSKLRETLLDSVTVLIISLLFLGELLILIFQFLGKKRKSEGGDKRIHYHAIRPAAFLLLFGTDIAISFVPLYMEQLYEPLWGLSKEIVLGLPISANVFFTGAAILLAGNWVDRRGWHEPFFTGLVLNCAGFLYAWFAVNALHFIIARSLIGLGYGLSLMAAQGFVIFYTDETNKAKGISRLIAGLYAGSICGGATGAMLADRLGFRFVFLIGAVIVASIILYAVTFMGRAIGRPSPAEERDETIPAVGAYQSIRFLLNFDVLVLILLSLIPTAIALVGFINYYTPLYLNRIGETQSNIGRIFMVYGICIIYLSPLIGKYVDKTDNKAIFLSLSGVIGGSAFIFFHFSGGLVATAIAVVLLGAASSFAFSSQDAYALKLRITQKIGRGKAISLLSSARRIGQVIGPVIFGGLIASATASKSIQWFGFLYLILTLVFLVFSHRGRSKA